VAKVKATYSINYETWNFEWRHKQCDS